jgi:hypothetical protein
VGKYPVTQEEKEDLLARMANPEEIEIGGCKATIGEVGGKLIAVGLDPYGHRVSAMAWLDQILLRTHTAGKQVRALVACEHHENQWCAALLVRNPKIENSRVLELFLQVGHASDKDAGVFRIIYVLGGATLTLTEIGAIIPENYFNGMSYEHMPIKSSGDAFVFPEKSFNALHMYYRVSFLYFAGSVITSPEWMEMRSLRARDSKALVVYGEQPDTPTASIVDLPAKWQELNPIKDRACPGVNLVNKHSLYKCGLCWQAADLKKCSRCKRAWYCGIACQRKHWAAHKPHCVPAEKSTKK